MNTDGGSHDGECPAMAAGSAAPALRAEVAALRAERDEWKQQAEGVNADLLDALAEVVTLRVEVIKWKDAYLRMMEERDYERGCVAEKVDEVRALRVELDEWKADMATEAESRQALDGGGS